jgi:hypothetical protein
MAYCRVVYEARQLAAWPLPGHRPLALHIVDSAPVVAAPPGRAPPPQQRPPLHGWLGAERPRPLLLYPLSLPLSGRARVGRLPPRRAASGCERGGRSLPPLDRASNAHHGSDGAACRTQPATRTLVRSQGQPHFFILRAGSLSPPTRSPKQNSARRLAQPAHPGRPSRILLAAGCWLLATW